MKDIDNIEDWYRNELNDYSVEPDKSGWSSLSDELDSATPLTDDTISDWYKKEISKLEELPDYTVWEKLSTKLDTSSVWEKLAISLNRYDQLIWWRNIAIRASAIFLLCFGSFLTYKSYIANNNAIAFSQTSSSKTDISSLTASAVNNRKENTETKTNQSVYKKVYTSQNQPNEQKTFQNLSNNNKNTHLSNSTTGKMPETKLKNNVNAASVKKKNDLKNTYASKEIITKTAAISVENLERLKTINNKTLITEINRHPITSRDISHLIDKGDYLVKKERNKIVFNTKRFSSYSMFGIYTRRFYAGFNLGLKKQGMLTTLKKESLLANYQQNTLLDFGSSFGGTVGFLLSDKINLETNININSTSGYKRSFSSEGIVFQENLNLNYSTINFLVKKMNSKSTFDNKIYSTNFIGGIYASYLKSASSDAHETGFKIDDFKQLDYGLVVGIEQDRYLTRTLIITPGIRYNQGISSITNNSSSFNTARNFSFEFNLGVKYIFLKKS